MGRTVIATGDAPKAIGPYSQAIRSSGAGDLLFCSGQIALDPATGEMVGGGDVRLEAERVMANVRAVLAAGGCSFADVVKTTIFLRDMGDFQAVAHLLVDLSTRAEAIRLLVYRGGELHDAGLPHVKEASMAKIASSELYADVARYCMQLHGGYGYIDEHPLTMHYVDAVIATVAGGASQVQRNIVARELGLKPR